MKYIVVLLLSLTALFTEASAQTTNQEGYLFDGFKDGIVYYRDGRQFSVPLNYNLITRQFVFIDKGDDSKEKEFSDPDMIISISIENRSFLPPSEGAVEILQAEPEFYVSFEGSIRSEKSTSYGGKTQTASVDAYSHLGEAGRVSEAEKSLAKIDKEYRVKIGKKKKRFYTEKQFLKLFPNKQEEIARYLEQNSVEFEDEKQVLKAYNFAHSLK